jgi:hypothetical protein
MHTDRTCFQIGQAHQHLFHTVHFQRAHVAALTAVREQLIRGRVPDELWLGRRQHQLVQADAAFVPAWLHLSQPTAW